MQKLKNFIQEHRKLSIAIGGILAVALIGCCLIAVFAGGGEEAAPEEITKAVEESQELSEPTDTTAPTVTRMPTDSPGPTDTPRPTNTPAPPTDTPSPEEEVRRIVQDTLGSSNREVQRVQELRVTFDRWIHIKWAINDNLTADMIKGSAKLDVTQVAESLCKADYCSGLTMRGTFSMQDQYGNVSEDVVVEVVLGAETLGKINWDHFLFENIYAVADSVNLHPEFQD